jgi:signal transduction histidine kinase
MARALKGEASTETIRLGKMWIRSSAAPILLKEKIIGGVAVNTDITQDRLQEEMLRKSEKLAAVGQLASAIAHEINNPLESLTNLLYLIRQSEGMEEIREYASMAQIELTRVSEITVQTLRFHRQQNTPTGLDVEGLLRTIVVLYSGRFLVRGIGVEWKVVPTPQVFCLEGEVRQLLNNLIRNAIDAMDDGGKLFVRVRPARGLGPRNGDRPGVRITIADTGEGICPEMRAHLFEPFHTTKDVTGTGLGLWVSKGIVDKHEGTITVRSRTSGAHGTAFAVWLPLENACLMAAAGEEQAALDA